MKFINPRNITAGLLICEAMMVSECDWMGKSERVMIDAKEDSTGKVTFKKMNQIKT